MLIIRYVKRGDMDMKHLIYSIESLVDIIFPRYCKICARALIHQELEICTGCYMNLPITHSWKNSYNPMEKIFSGRVKFHHQFALLNFEKKGVTQKLMHQIKYKEEKSLAIYLGSLLGQALITLKNEIDLLVPIPLHPKKLKRRGFNQAQLIAEGISKVWETPISYHLLTKTVDNVSQTTLSRKDKFLNVQDVFTFQSHALTLSNPHIMLVDDVCTTGSTLESCALSLQQSLINKISVATLAVVSQI